jgi:hypothetical protein
MSQASIFLSPFLQIEDSNGSPLAGGVFYFYAAGTTTPKAVYADSAMGTSLGVSVTLDSAGRGEIWLDGYYYVVLKDSIGNTIKTQDNVSSSYSQSTPAAATYSEWAVQSDVLTYIGATKFSVPGDKTLVYVVGKRIKATVTAGTITGTITGSSAGGSPIKTTVTVLWDLSQALDSGLSAVSVGIIGYIAGGAPYQLPIGAVLPWYKSMTGVPELTYGWVQCDGQTLIDVFSPMNGQVIPNLNGAAAGADTFSNSKAAVYLRGGATSGTYSADAVASHTHATTSLTTAPHTHTIGAGSTAGASQDSHNHTVNILAQHAVAAGSGTNNIWQDGTDVRQTDTTNSASPAITLSGSTGVASDATLTGTLSANGAAPETIPKTVTAVMIIRVK